MKSNFFTIIDMIVKIGFWFFLAVEAVTAFWPRFWVVAGEFFFPGDYIAPDWVLDPAEPKKLRDRVNKVYFVWLLIVGIFVSPLFLFLLAAALPLVITLPILFQKLKVHKAFEPETTFQIEAWKEDWKKVFFVRDYPTLAQIDATLSLALFTWFYATYL